jgi:hypothetical protein
MNCNASDGLQALGRAEGQVLAWYQKPQQRVLELELELELCFEPLRRLLLPRCSSLGLVSLRFSFASLLPRLAMPGCWCLCQNQSQVQNQMGCSLLFLGVQRRAQALVFSAQQLVL